MTLLPPFARVAGALSLLLALTSACGGKSITIDANDGGSDQGGSANTAGQASAGKSPGGGAVGAGGSAPSNGGASSAGAGAVAGTGSAGYAGEGCSAPPDSGECRGAIPAWYHDATTGICRPFTYGGCGGNANVYASLADCQQACSLGTPNYDACNQPSDCVVTGTGCCGVCDGPGVDASSLIAFNPKYLALGPFQCAIPLEAPAPGGPTPGADPIVCAPCPPVEDGTLKYFVPDCVRGQCSIVDLRQSPLTACKTSEECVLRHGTQCCESCDANDLVALRRDVGIEKLVCGTPVPCLSCVAEPTSAVAYCAPSGHCEVGLPVTSE